MSTILRPERLDPVYEQINRLELQPVDERPRELRERLLHSLVRPWRGREPGDPGSDSDHWFAIVCEDALGEGGAGWMSLHEIADRLRVTDVRDATTMHYLSLTDRNRLMQRFRNEVVAPLEDRDQVIVHESGSVGSLDTWIDADALDALDRFVSATKPTASLDDPEAKELWNRFLVLALPVRDGSSFGEGVRSVLMRYGWSESAANELRTEVENANFLLDIRRSIYL